VDTSGERTVSGTREWFVSSIERPQPLAGGGCLAALARTNGPDELLGGEASEVIIGFGGRDRIEAGGEGTTAWSGVPAGTRSTVDPARIA
jgi:hypothetical protein